MYDSINGPYGLAYNWNLGAIHFEVLIVGYGEEEGRKVVESMIK